MMPRQTKSQYALKEWAAICTALESGRQTILLRKGGIEEGPHGFQVQHNPFWLYPTRYHQSPGELTLLGAECLAKAKQTAPPAGCLRLQLFARVEEACRIKTESDALRLAPSQVMTPQTVLARFHYRQPGLFALLLRVYRAGVPREIPERPEFAGCRSWIDLGGVLSAEECQPVLSDSEFLTWRQNVWPCGITAQAQN